MLVGGSCGKGTGGRDPQEHSFCAWYSTFDRKAVWLGTGWREDLHSAPMPCGSVSRNPRLSVRVLARRIAHPRTSVHRILRKWLRLYPYKLQRVHSLRRGDKAARVPLCEWLLPKLCSPAFKKFFFMSDEAHFYLDGRVTKQNCRIWGSEPPGVIVPQDPYAPHVTAWCAVSCSTVIGPYFLWASGHTVTVTAARCRFRGSSCDSLHAVASPCTVCGCSRMMLLHTPPRGCFRTLQGPSVLTSSPSMDPRPGRRVPLTSLAPTSSSGWLKSQVYQTLPKPLPQLKCKLRQAVR